ncbi:uncharacterized protein [Anabrus simplex]|uniref:uncharacterized protein isoform X2 n=1 Tax=Anabrus simplex TaxID=316456 RepID=UPI0035A3A8BC
MDNLGFQPDLESGYFHHQTSVNENVCPHSNSSSPYVIFPDNNSRRGAKSKKHNSMLLLSKPGSSNIRPPKLSSSSFNVPKKSNVCKYRRFSGSMSLKRSRVLKDLLEETERNNASALNNEPIYCSISELKPKNVEPDQDISSINSLYQNNSKLYETPISNNLKSSQTTSVPSSPLTRNSFSTFARSQSSRDTQRYTASPSLLKQNRSKLENVDSINLSASKSTNFNNERSSPSLIKKINHFAVEENSLAYLSKCSNNCVDTVAAKNTRNLQQEFLRPPEAIPTVSGGVPMFLYPQQSSPRPSADNKRNLRRSSKMESDGGRGARLKKRGMLRGWKLQFIPSDHSQRKNLLLCCMLGLACALILLATGLVVYVTTVMGSLTAKLEKPWHTSEMGINVVAGEFRIVNEQYEPVLQNSSSSDYKQLAQQITQLLDLVFSRSTLSGNYNHSHVTHLVQPSPSGASGLVVKCQVVLASAPPHGEAANLVGLEFLRGLEHRQGQMWLGDFVVDVQSIGFVALLDDTVPVSNVTPSSSLQPGWSAWSDWSDCNITSPGGRAVVGYTQSRTRLCRLDQGRGSALSSIEPCLLLEAGGGDLEVRDCDHTGHSNDTVDVVMSATMFKNINRPRFSINTAKDSENRTGTFSRVILAGNTSEEWAATNESEAHTVDLPETTSKIPVMDLSLSLRHCDECIEGEVCVALSIEQVPICRQPLDREDPTGCGGHCLINTELCQKLDVDAFRCVDDSYCLPTEWRCGNQLCIPEVKRCDGHMNCYDRTDEHDCDCNLETHFHCGNNTSCLPNKKRCDGVIDCWDGTDELNCTIACPNASQFTCTNGQCIPRARFCDGYSDCSDNSDEPFGCGGECKNHEWKCRNGRCIKKQMVCDGTDSCGDHSDEHDCPLRRRERNFEDALYVERLFVR